MTAFLIIVSQGIFCLICQLGTLEHQIYSSSHVVSKVYQAVSALGLSTQILKSLTLTYGVVNIWIFG